MSCAVMYHSYPSSSPYLLPTGPPGPPTNNTLPSLSGFDRINQVAAHGGPSATVPSAAVTPPVNSPQSPNQRLPPVNGIPLEPKIEKVTFLWSFNGSVLLLPQFMLSNHSGIQNESSFHMSKRVESYCFFRLARNLLIWRIFPNNRGYIPSYVCNFDVLKWDLYVSIV